MLVLFLTSQRKMQRPSFRFLLDEWCHGARIYREFKDFLPGTKVRQDLCRNFVLFKVWTMTKKVTKR